MGMLLVISNYRDDFQELALLLGEESIIETCQQRLREFTSLSFHKRLLSVLMSRYVPSNMDFFTEDVKLLANFHKTKFGNWENISIHEILEDPMLILIEKLEDSLSFLEENQASLIL